MQALLYKGVKAIAAKISSQILFLVFVWFYVKISKMLNVDIWNFDDDSNVDIFLTKICGDFVNLNNIKSLEIQSPMSVDQT